MGNRIADLRLKEVINIHSGCRLGFVNDVEVDVVSGRVIALIVPGPCKFGIFPLGEDYVIPWDSICKIGDDIILVDFELHHAPVKNWRDKY
ncbi:MAG: YlmC/YmxH family sporulation protein [Oscillospiraceae bacterium]|jgi:YlmC/YmxH family sporulation protein|nr:YlmC/YmxH family sporulation protein [Oscillospiraceae bacterium]